MTSLFGIVAHPVAHSLSPVMQRAAFQAAGIDATFEAFDVKAEGLDEFMELRTDIEGLAVSIPHKENIGKYLDGVDKMAQKIGAVNTVYRKNGKRWGTNTDAPGFLNALSEVMPNLAGKRVVVIGAGGTARAILSVLVPRAGSVTIINRTAPHGVALAEAFGCRYGGKIEDLDTETPDLIVNATSVGLDAEHEPDLVPPGFMKPSMVAFDIVYRRHGTPKFAEHAKAAGATLIQGERMLFHQGILQFELWTGKPAPREAMEQALHC